MPAGVPVGTLAIGRAGAVNAALLAAAILGTKHPRFREALERSAPGRRRGARRPGPAPDSGPRSPRRVREGRRPRRRPARPDAGAAPATRSGMPLPLPRPGPGGARRPRRASWSLGAYDDPAALDRFARRARRRHLRVRERPASAPRRRLATRGAGVSAAAARSRSRRTGSPRSASSSRRGIADPPFVAVGSRAELDRGRRRSSGCPAVLKTRRLGYDGKGQRVLRGPGDVERGVGAAGRRAAGPRGLRRFRPRAVHPGRAGARTARPPATRSWRTSTRGGILRRSLAPAPGVTPALQGRAEEHARRVLETLDYVGRARHRALPGRRPAPRQRDGAARPQLGALDDRGSGDEPVREPPPRGRAASRSARRRREASARC